MIELQWSRLKYIFWVGFPSNKVPNNVFSSHLFSISVVIHWAIKCVTRHHSYNSNADTDALFRNLFPDSKIAQNFQCGATKCMYIICHGLAPYFKRQAGGSLQTWCALCHQFWWISEPYSPGGTDGLDGSFCWWRKAAACNTDIWVPISLATWDQMISQNG